MASKASVISVLKQVHTQPEIPKSGYKESLLDSLSLIDEDKPRILSIPDIHNYNPDIEGLKSKLNP